MKIVIDISEEDYKGLQRKAKFNDMCLLYYEKLIVCGTPLPKGHGRLGDLDRLYKVFERNVVGVSAFKDLFDSAPTIIEADSGEKE